MAVTKIPKKTVTLIEPKRSFIVDKAQHSVESCGDASAAWTTERNTVPNPSQWTSKPSKEPS